MEHGVPAQPPASLRLVQPHPGFAHSNSRLRSQSVANSSPNNDVQHRQGPFRGPSDGSEWRHGHSSSDVEIQVPVGGRHGPAPGLPMIDGRARSRTGTDRAQERRLESSFDGPLYSRADPASAQSHSASTDDLLNRSDLVDVAHSREHSFPHPPAGAGYSRDGDQVPQPATSGEGGFTRWKETALHANESPNDTPRASGIVDVGAMATIFGDSSVTPAQPPVRPALSGFHSFAASSQSLNALASDPDSEQQGGMPPITLGILRHHRQTSSIDSADSPPVRNAHTGRPHATSLNERVILQELANSKDEGDTLDLSRKGIDRISEGDVQILRYGVGKGRKGVWRLALSYNRLKHYSFDRSMNTLGRLRYLNLKGNNLIELPSVLTEMPSLEILDVSKNEIVELPEDPGRLVQLRVLSLTRNKLVRLPSYLAHFANLRVLKVEENPIAWPPREILGLLPTQTAQAHGGQRPVVKKDDDMRIWIATVKDWLRSQEQEQIRLVAEGLRSASDAGRIESQAYVASEPLVHNKVAPASPAASIGSVASNAAAVSGAETDMPETPVEGPGDSSVSLVRMQSGQGSHHTSRPSSPPMMYKPALATPSPPRPPRNRQRSQAVAGASSPSSSLGMSRSVSSGPLASLRGSDGESLATLTFPPSASNLERETSTSSIKTVKESNQGHARGSSYTGSQRLSTQLSSKKSLPDLRQSHERIIGERLGMTPVNSSAGLQARVRNSRISGGFSTPPGLTTAEPSDVPARRVLTGKPSLPNLGMQVLDSQRHIARKASDDALGRASRTQDQAAGTSSLHTGRPLITEMHPQVDDPRNSYFRRLSTLPASSISKLVPLPLLQFVDGIRSLLFALSQGYAAFRQYLLSAAQERVASVFLRVMDPGCEYMNVLINALDRFDSMTRRRVPPASAVRAVIEACRDNVAVFAKVVAVLELQITALADVGDVRYTKTLLLLLYGSLAEVSAAWTSMASLLDDVRHLLRHEPLSAASSGLPSGHGIGHRVGTSISSSGRTPISPIPEKLESSPGHASTADTTPQVSAGGVVTASNTSTDITPTRPVAMARERSRRNAGSFSSEDVQVGMMLGPDPVADEDAEVNDSGILMIPSRGPREVKLPDGPVIEEDEDRLREAAMPSPAKLRGRRAASDDITMTTPVSPGSPLEPPRPPFAQSRHGQSSSTGNVNLSIGSADTSSSSGTASKPRAHFYGEGGPPLPSTPGGAASIVDEGVLDTLEQASDVAFTVWTRIADDLSFSPTPASTSQMPGMTTQLTASSGGPLDSSSVNAVSTSSSYRTQRVGNLLSSLTTAEELTRKLRESLMEVRTYDFDQSMTPASSSGSSARSLIPAHARLSSDAQAFIRIVVKVSEQIISLQSSREHVFPSSVKTLLAKLTNKTRECGILMQVSTLKPTTMTTTTTTNDSHSVSSSRGSSTSSSLGGPRAYSPVFSYNHHQPGSSSDLSRQVGGLHL